jgi:hypothetical protein
VTSALRSGTWFSCQGGIRLGQLGWRLRGPRVKAKTKRWRCQGLGKNFWLPGASKQAAQCEGQDKAKSRLGHGSFGYRGQASSRPRVKAKARRCQGLGMRILANHSGHRSALAHLQTRPSSVLIPPGLKAVIFQQVAPPNMSEMLQTKLCINWSNPTTWWVKKLGA